MSMDCNECIQGQSSTIGWALIPAIVFCTLVERQVVFDLIVIESIR